MGSCPTQPDSRAETIREETENQGTGQTLMDASFQHLVGLERTSDHCQAGNGHPMEPPPIQGLLAQAVETEK